MAESLSEAGRTLAINATMSSGGDISINISTDSVEVANLVCKAGITLSALYFGYKLATPLVNSVIKKALGGERDDQEVQDISRGSLLVKLHCSTDERFLEVLGYYESGEMKKRFEEEFSQAGIKVEGLKVKIENVEEVNETKEAIIQRKVENIEGDDADSDKKGNTNISTAAKEEGYDVSRFVGEVRDDILCSICKCVPKDPRLCKNKDHFFCLAHISQHLLSSETCPNCRDPLTADTLRKPSGFLKNYIDDLKIKCDHIDRGCPDELSLEGLQRHVDECEFAPVMCGNEGCEMVVNKRDQDKHEKYLCEFRFPKCHDCKDIKASQDEMKDEMKVELSKMKDKMTELEGKQEQTKESVDEMKQQFEKVMIMVNQALQGSNVNNNGAQATDPRVSSNNQDIVILGGWYAPGKDKLSNTVEIFNIVEGKSTELPRMIKPRAKSASCVYNGEVMAVGGEDDQDGTYSIEILKMNEHPPRWTMFAGKLPVKLKSHAAVVYQNKLHAVGGCNYSETSDIIYEVDLAPPYDAKPLARMPQERRDHRAEIVDGKLFILGGSTTRNNKGALDSVVVYDFITKRFKKCPPLPKPVCYMSTVTWGNKIIVVGGQDKNDQVLNDVIMYDTETGRSERLPSMKHKRRASSAVIADGAIVVLGGWNNEQKYLNSVESFTVGSDGWKELPGMKVKRSFATAVVVPRM